MRYDRRADLPPELVRDRFFTLADKHGFPPEEAIGWAYTLVLRSLREIREIAPVWHAHAFTAPEAERWMELFPVFRPDLDIMAFRDAGYTPEQARKLAHATHGPHRWLAWLDVPVPGNYAWRYALAGINPSEAATWETRRIEGHDVLIDLRLLAALRTPPGTRLTW